MSLITAPRASSRFLNRVDDTGPSSLLDLSPISGQSWVGHGAAIDLSALPIPHSPSLIGTGSVGGFGHIGGAVHPVRNRRPGIFGYRLDEIVQAFVLADGDGEADIHPAADGDHGVGIEAAVSPHGELPAGPATGRVPGCRRSTPSGGPGSGGQVLPRARGLEIRYAGD